MTAQLRIVRDGDADALLTLRDAYTRAAQVARRVGAQSLEDTVIDENGNDWDQKLWQPGPAPQPVRMLRYRVMAVFPDGHTATGDSDEFKATDPAVYQFDATLRIQACQRLIDHWQLSDKPKPIEEGP